MRGSALRLFGRLDRYVGGLFFLSYLTAFFSRGGALPHHGHGPEPGRLPQLVGGGRGGSHGLGRAAVVRPEVAVSLPEDVALRDARSGDVHGLQAGALSRSRGGARGRDQCPALALARIPGRGAAIGLHVRAARMGDAVPGTSTGRLDRSDEGATSFADPRGLHGVRPRGTASCAWRSTRRRRSRAAHPRFASSPVSTAKGLDRWRSPPNPRRRFPTAAGGSLGPARDHRRFAPRSGSRSTCSTSCASLPPTSSWPGRAARTRKTCPFPSRALSWRASQATPSFGRCSSTT